MTASLPEMVRALVHDCGLPTTDDCVKIGGSARNRSGAIHDRLVPPATSMSEPTTETRDYLALVRTHLANERTLLAYGRTALMVSATGATLLKFYPDSPTVQLLSWPLVVLGVLIALFGIVRFARLQSRLRIDK